jgi:hypothetical protein
MRCSTGKVNLPSGASERRSRYPRTQLARRIAAQDYDVISRWAETSRLSKLRVAARCAAWNPQEKILAGGRIRLPDVM